MGNELTEAERLIRFETELIAVKEAVYELKKILIMREESYYTKDVIEEKLRLRDRDIERLQDDLKRLNNDFDKYQDTQRDEKRTNKQILPNWIHIFFYAAITLVGAAMYLKR